MNSFRIDLPLSLFQRLPCQMLLQILLRGDLLISNRLSDLSQYFPIFHFPQKQIQLVRHWLFHTRQRICDQQGEENVNRVFSVTSLQSGQPNEQREKVSLWRRLTRWSFEETSTFFYYWSFLVFLGCFYNLVMIVVMVFEEVSRLFYKPWIAGNLLCDGVFILDILILTRKEFIDDGVRTRDPLKMLKYRIFTRQFLFDVLAILPTDLLLFLRHDFSISRLNRLLKCYRISEFDGLTQIRTNFPNVFRISKLILTCFIIFHWNGCVYFIFALVYDFKTAVYDDWIFSYDKIPNPIIVTCNIFDPTEANYCSTDVIVPLRVYAEDIDLHIEAEYSEKYWGNWSREVAFSNFTKQYGLSFYWSALTLVTLGEQPPPNRTLQNAFEIGDTLLGLVLFAVIVGDVGNMVYNMNLKKSQFEEVLDGCKRFMIYKHVSPVLQGKAKEYFSYIWSHGGGQMEEEEIAEFLPPRLYGQLAVHIHMETLRKVKLFEDCELNLLFELILRLEPRVYSPMDYICKKGEVGTEMYVVKQGFVEVVNEDGSVVFVRLGDGTVFGELAILNIPGNKNGNRRTANVRSVGYSDLYVLNKDALWEALRQYPEATRSLMAKGKQLLQKDNLYDEALIEGEEFDPGAPVESQLEMLQQAAKTVEEKITQAEDDFTKYSCRMKQRLFLLEKNIAEEIAELKGEIRSKLHESSDETG